MSASGRRLRRAAQRRHSAPDEDRAWFSEHPCEQVRIRPARADEMAAWWPHVANLPPGEVLVEVVQLAPGVRTRAPYIVFDGEPR